MFKNYKIIGKRNPKIILDNGVETYTIQTIGDPHLGRNYRNNNRDRLGDREKSIRISFLHLLNEPSDITVILGDLFDKVSVTNEWFSFSIKALSLFAEKNPEKKLIILNGNHDLTKDVHRVSSFKLLEKYFKLNDTYPNIIFLDNITDYIYLDKYNTSLCFTNYDPFSSLDDLQIPVLRLFEQTSTFKIAFGHFEVDDFGSDKYINRQIPNTLLDNFDLVVTGHIHKPYSTKIKNADILVVGSMQPYAFGEEIQEDGDLYVTINIDELKGILEKTPNYFENSNVRILYTKGDELLPPFNCYSVIYKQLVSETNDLNSILKDVDNISFSSMFLESLVKNKTEENSVFIDKIEKVFLEKDFESD